MKKKLILLAATGLTFSVAQPLQAGLLDDFISGVKKGISEGLQKTQDDSVSSTHLQGKPIPTDPSAPTGAVFSQLSLKWFTRAMLEPYQHTAQPDPKVAAFIQEGIELFSGANGHLTATGLSREADDLARNGIDDPAFNLVSGVVHEDYAVQRACFEKALAKMPGSPYPKFIEFTISANLGKTLSSAHANPAEIEQRDQASLALLKEALSTDAFTKEEMSVLRERLAAPSGSDLMSRKADEVQAILDASTHIEPWVAEFYAGLHDINLAWKSRGGGWANSVTDNGWKGFEKYIALARENLVKAWTANPKDPLAATNMITVAMAESESNDTMRSWFDRATVSQMDCMLAYNQMLWGLRPRWLGSYDQMLQFGSECAATKRYDTCVPYQYIVAVRDVSSDAEDEGKIFADPEINRQMLDVISGYLSAPRSAMSPTYLHTLAAIFAYKAGNTDEAKKQLAAIQNHPDPAPDLARLVNMQSMLQDLSVNAQ
ncbi:MAG: hypothetical protein QM796_21770 [Chthoniobacteraceae bacterium]